MHGKILFQTDLDFTKEFQTKRERGRYIKQITRQFRQALDREFNPNMIPEPSREKIMQFFRAFAEISTAFYVPILVHYFLSENIMWFGVKSDYISVDCKDLPAWETILKEASLEFVSDDDGTFWMESALVGVFNKNLIIFL